MEICALSQRNPLFIYSGRAKNWKGKAGNSTSQENG